MLSKITPCLWFDTQAEEAARFYVSVFKNSKITAITHYPEDMHGKKKGEVLVVAFELEGQSFTALNGGPMFQLSEAVSFQVDCATQEEIDYYWDKLREGGDPECQQCGWLKDKFGASWQIVPSIMTDYVNDLTNAGSLRAFKAMCEMRKMDIAALKKAYDGR